jgi:ferritin-like metal-binding protein YciE
MASLDDLFLTTLKDIYYAELQILKALPKMVKAAQNPDLKQAFSHHLEETEGQVERLQQVFEALGKRPQTETCEAIKGIIEEADELLQQMKEPSAVRDAGLVASGQAVEHYEMSRYGSLMAWAKAAGRDEVVGLLRATLDQEKQADKLLSQLATRTINADAMRAAS